MKLIILAAGKGERLMPLTCNTPKPLLDVGNGRTLIETQITSVKHSGVIEEIVLVIGYLGGQIEAKLETFNSEMAIKTLFNPFFSVSNNLMSLWLARNEMNDDFLVTNGDNLFSPDVFEQFVKTTDNGIHLAVSKKNQFDYDDMRVSVKDDVIARVSKQIPLEESHAESPGLLLVRGLQARKVFISHLERIVRRPESLNAFWLELFNQLYQNGIPTKPWWFDAQNKWQEIDFHGDMDQLKQLIRLTSKLSDAIDDES